MMLLQEGARTHSGRVIKDVPQDVGQGHFRIEVKDTSRTEIESQLG